MNQMMEAVATRDLIGQAKGILMERYKVTPRPGIPDAGQGQQR